MRLAGVLPVIQTPYRDDDTIDTETLRREIDWLFACGVDGVVTGMVSEVLRLDADERDTLHAALVEIVAGRGPVIASVGGESAVQAARNARRAQALGVDAVMATPPMLTRCDDAGLLAYYSRLFDAIELPVVVQDASGYVGNPIPIAVQAELFRRYPARAHFKPEAPPIGASVSALRAATQERAPIFEGSGGVALMDTYRRGIVGTMPGADLPWALVALWRALEAGDVAQAQAIHGPLASLLSLVHNLDGYLAMEKLLLKAQGIFVNETVRGPVGASFDEATRTEVLRLTKCLRAATLSPAAGGAGG